MSNFNGPKINANCSNSEVAFSTLQVREDFMFKGEDGVCTAC